MLLYHFTDKHIKDSIKTSFFGDNIYTDKDKSISKLARAFFFTESTAPEYRFKACKYKYIVNINSKLIYNLAEDKRRLINKYKDIDKLLHHIKSLGYKGALYNVSYNIVILFYDVKIKEEL